MIENRKQYIAPATEEIGLTGSSDILQGSNSPSYEYGDNDLGELS